MKEGESEHCIEVDFVVDDKNSLDENDEKLQEIEEKKFPWFVCPECSSQGEVASLNLKNNLLGIKCLECNKNCQSHFEDTIYFVAVLCKRSQYDNVYRILKENENLLEELQLEEFAANSLRNYIKFVEERGGEEYEGEFKIRIDE